MKTMKNVLVSCMAGVSLLLASCTPSAVDTLPKAGYGNVSFGVKTKTDFSGTRAVNEDDYANTENYTVEFIKMPDEVAVETFLYKDRKATYQLPNGSYVIKVYHGKTYENLAKSKDGFYVEGRKTFDVNADQQKLNVDCFPTCGCLKTNFDASMSDDFSNYYVIYETAALSAAGDEIRWESSDTDPYYVKLNKDGEIVKATIHITRKSDNTSTTISKEYVMTPGMSWTMNIAPKDGSGSLGIIITIDEGTNDREEPEIVIPSDWI